MMRRRGFFGGGDYSVAHAFFIPFPFFFPFGGDVFRYSVDPVPRWRGVPSIRCLGASSASEILGPPSPRPSPRWRGVPIRLGNTRLASVPRLPRVEVLRPGEMFSRRAPTRSRIRHPDEATQGSKAHEAQRTISSPRLASSPRICDTVPHIGDLPSPHPRGIIPSSIGRSPRGKRPPHQDARQLRRR